MGYGMHMMNFRCDLFQMLKQCLWASVSLYLSSVSFLGVTLRHIVFA